MYVFDPVEYFNESLTTDYNHEINLILEGSNKSNFVGKIGELISKLWKWIKKQCKRIVEWFHSRFKGNTAVPVSSILAKELGVGLATGAATVGISVGIPKAIEIIDQFGRNTAIHVNRSQWVMKAKNDGNSIRYYFDPEYGNYKKADKPSFHSHVFYLMNHQEAIDILVDIMSTISNPATNFIELRQRWNNFWELIYVNGVHLREYSIDTQTFFNFTNTLDKLDGPIDAIVHNSADPRYAIDENFQFVTNHIASLLRSICNTTANISECLSRVFQVDGRLYGVVKNGADLDRAIYTMMKAQIPADEISKNVIRLVNTDFLNVDEHTENYQVLATRYKDIFCFKTGDRRREFRVALTQRGRMLNKTNRQWKKALDEFMPDLLFGGLHNCVTIWSATNSLDEFDKDGNLYKNEEYKKFKDQLIQRMSDNGINLGRTVKAADCGYKFINGYLSWDSIQFKGVFQ